MTALKETKAQRVERLKHAESVEAHRRDRALRTRGLGFGPPGVARKRTFAGGASTPRAMASARSAARAARARPFRHFMVRVRGRNGSSSRSSPAPDRRLFAECHGRGIADITVRQNFQLHWVTIEALPDIVRRLAKVGISTLRGSQERFEPLLQVPAQNVLLDEDLLVLSDEDALPLQMLEGLRDTRA